jgi:phosphoribosyl 1,2-cyclic phosphodiesterase
MGFASLGSGSKGNATLVALAGEGDAQDAIFMVDCGFTLKQTERRLQRLGLGCGDIDAIFVSHEHSDHKAGVAALAHRYSIPVYASYGTARKLDLQCNRFDGDQELVVAGVTINPVRVPHDAQEPTQFTFTNGQETVGVLSDIGMITTHVLEQFRPCTHLLMEANHDVKMLAAGSYPASLKRRVGESYGHLSNDQAFDLLSAIAHQQLSVVVGHISEQNNCQTLLGDKFAPLEKAVKSIEFATQAEGAAWVGYQPLSRQASFSDVV